MLCLSALYGFHGKENILSGVEPLKKQTSSWIRSEQLGNQAETNLQGPHSGRRHRHWCGYGSKPVWYLCRDGTSHSSLLSPGYQGFKTHSMINILLKQEAWPKRNPKVEHLEHSRTIPWRSFSSYQPAGLKNSNASSFEAYQSYNFNCRLSEASLKKMKTTPSTSKRKENPKIQVEPLQNIQKYIQYPYHYISLPHYHDNRFFTDRTNTRDTPRFASQSQLLWPTGSLCQPPPYGRNLPGDTQWKKKKKKLYENDYQRQECEAFTKKVLLKF